MNQPPKTTQAALAQAAPVLSELQRQRVDQAMHADKLANGYAARNFQQAMQLQIDRAAGSPL